MFIQVKSRVWFPQDQPGHFSSYLLSSGYIAVKVFVVAWQHETEERGERVRSVAHWREIIFAVYVFLD
jgi:hypothetical protein